MKKNILDLKIFNNNKNNKFKFVSFNVKKGDAGKIKYLPPYFKEWNNTIFHYNKNLLINTPTNTLTINKLLRSYFNLFYKNDKNIPSKIRRILLKNIYISKAEIKYTNSIAIITLYSINLRKYIFTRYLNLFYYYSIIKEWEKYKNNNLESLKKDSFSLVEYIKKNSFRFIGIEAIFFKTHSELTLKNKLMVKTDNTITLRNILNLNLKLLNTGLESYNVYRKIFLIKEIKHIYYQYLLILYKYNYEYYFNNLKLKEGRISFISKLKLILSKILNKKIELNIINLKSIVYNSDLFTEALIKKLKKKRFNVIKSMITMINKGKIIPKYKVFENERIRNSELFENKYKDLNLISLMNRNNLSSLLKDIYSSKEIYNYYKEDNFHIYKAIFNSIKFKNMGGIRLEVKGRLTRRYRADRAIYKLFWKGGLKNIDSSYRRISSVLFRGYLNSNTSYSMSKSKRRIGSFAVKGWISGR